MEKTLGGDRLGSGKKLKVDLHGYNRSTHDIGYLWRSTMSAGTLVPFMSEIALPGDTFDINLDVDIKTHPTIGPLFGSYKVQLDIFQAPIRLYNAQLHNNKLGIGMDMSKVKLPNLAMLARAIPDTILGDIDNSQINPSSLLSYLGIRGVGYVPAAEVDPAPRSFNAIPMLAYWEIFKNYYANKQETDAYVIHSSVVTPAETVTDFTIEGDIIEQFPDTGSPVWTGLGANKVMEIVFSAFTENMLDNIKINYNVEGTQFDILSNIITSYEMGGVGGLTAFIRYTGTGKIAYSWDYINQSQPRNGEPKLVAFPLSQIDDMRELILRHTPHTSAFTINTQGVEPYNLINWVDDVNPLLASQEGLAVKTYQSDLFNNWLSTEWIDGTDGITEITAIDTTGGSFTIDTLNLSKKVYDMLNRIAVSGGSYDDWIDAVYAHDRFKRAESPIYHGSLIRELVFQEVISNSESNSTGTNQPLGTLAGRGIMSGKKKGGRMTVRVDEPSYIIGIISLTPRVDYSQGNKWDVHLKTMNDLHKPALDEIGFQELITEQMAWWDTAWDTGTAEWIQKSAGKQPAWVNYMTNVNQTRGNFAIQDNEMFMTLNRRYEIDATTEEMKDLTTYIDPAKYNFIFADTATDAQNFWAQIAVDITARRKMSAKVMPNL